MLPQSRLRFCRVAFLLLCLLPTSGTVAWIGACRRPVNLAAERTDWELWLAEQSGLKVSVGGVSHPGGGVTRLGEVTLTDGETSEPIARSRQIDIGGDGRLLSIAVSQPEVHRRQMWRLWEVLHQRILRGEVDLPMPVDLLAAELTIVPDTDETATTIADFRCRLEPDAAGPRATIEFQDPSKPAAEGVQLQIVRNRQTTPSTTRWELDTRGSSIGCELLADDVTALGGLGPASTFQGTAWAAVADNGWNGEIRGRFENVDLDRIVSDRFPHKLSGRAEVNFERAVFRGGRIVDAAGTLHAAGGVVGMSLLDQAEKSLGMQISSQSQLTDQPLWRYRQLACDFKIGSGGLELTGRCDGPDAGVVFANEQGPLLTTTRTEVMPVVALVRTLSPDSAVQVPATLETDALLRALPIPAFSATTTAGGRRIFSPLRLR